MPLDISSRDQNVRIEFMAFDYRAAIDNKDPTIWFDMFVHYSDKTNSKTSTMDCTIHCIDGFLFNAFIDIEQDRVDHAASLIIKGYASSVDKFSLSKVSCSIS